MRKLVGVSRKKPTNQEEEANNQTNTQAMSTFSSGLYGGGSDPPSIGASFSSEQSSLVFIESESGGVQEEHEEYDDEVPPRSEASSVNVSMPRSDSSSEDSEIYAMLGSFEEKLESELQDLESLGVQSGANDNNSNKSRSSSSGGSYEKVDPEGSGSRTPSVISAAASHHSNSNHSNSNHTNASGEQSQSSFEKGKGKSGKNLARLSGKTDKIMSAYQAYLAEIQTDNMASSLEQSFSSGNGIYEDDDNNNENDDDDELDPALKNIHRIREDVRYNYVREEEHKRANNSSSHQENDDDDVESCIAIELPSGTTTNNTNKYAAGGGAPIVQLQRAWDYGDRTPGPMSDITSVGPATAVLNGRKNYSWSRPSWSRYATRSRGRRRDYAQPWLHSRKAKRGIAMAALAVFIVIVVSITAGVAKDEQKKKKVTSSSGDNDILVISENNNKQGGGGGGADHDWEAEYKAEVEKEEELRAEIRMDHEMEKRVPPPPLPVVVEVVAEATNANANGAETTSKLTPAAIAIIEETTAFASLPVKEEEEAKEEPDAVQQQLEAMQEELEAMETATEMEGDPGVMIHQELEAMKEELHELEASTTGFEEALKKQKESEEGEVNENENGNYNDALAIQEELEAINAFEEALLEKEEEREKEEEEEKNYDAVVDAYLHFDDKSFDKTDLEQPPQQGPEGTNEQDNENQQLQQEPEGNNEQDNENENLSESSSEPSEVQQVETAPESPDATTSVLQEQTPDNVAAHAATAGDHYLDAVAQYEPKMFDRTHGWNGQTYKEAVIFCQVAAQGMAVCPYEAVCPQGAGAEPLGGFRDGPHGDWAWVPVIDGWNEWVQVAAREKCVRYTHKFGEEPEWGVTGKGIAIEGITQNLMCCANVERKNERSRK